MASACCRVPAVADAQRLLLPEPDAGQAAPGNAAAGRLLRHAAEGLGEDVPETEVHQ